MGEHAAEVQVFRILHGFGKLEPQHSLATLGERIAVVALIG